MPNPPLSRPQEGPLPLEQQQRPVNTERAPLAPSEIVEQVQQEGGPSMHPENVPIATNQAPPPAPVATVGPVVEPQQKQMIESILSEGLEAEYQAMSPALQARFRQEGERVAVAVQALLHHSKNIARQILTLVRRWLGMIPGVNKFFLEQEAKIKTDRLLELGRPSDTD